MRRVAGYNLLERLASGPSSEVHLAHAAKLCALKLLKPRAAKDSTLVGTLLREAPRAIGFSHPVAIPVYEVARAGEDVFIAMELVEGQALVHVLHRAQQEGRPLAREVIVLIGRETASLLAAAHATPWADDTDEAMIHGAISPYNIFLTYDGRVRVLGSGLGRSRLSLPPSLGRLAYRAPNALESDRATAQDDIYSLGVLLHDAFTNDRAFRRASLAETKSAIRAGKLPRLKSVVEYAGDVLDELVAQMTSADPRGRPSDAAQVEQALRSQLRASDESMRTKIAELMARMFEHEIDAGQQMIDVARRKMDRGSRGSGPARPAEDLHSMPTPIPDVVTPVMPLPRLEDPIRPTDLLTQSGEREVRSLGLPTPPPLRPRIRSRPISKPLPPISNRPTSGSGEAPILGPRTRVPSVKPIRISRFEVSADLGRFGASNAYEAKAIEGKESVLLKVLDTDRIDDARLRPDEWTFLFDRELAIARPLKNPSLPLVIEAGLQGALRYVAYRRAEGTPLNVLLGQGRQLPPGAIRRLIATAADALGYLHGRSIVFANVQAQSILQLRDGSAMLSDLSFASPTADPPHPLLMTNIFALAPEYLATKEYHPHSDQFALGALLYELLTGTRPFRGLDDRAILATIREKEPLAPQTLDSRVDPVLAGAAMKMLEKHPRNRFPSCADVARQMREA
jgi:serine/threonine protein kinase